MHFAIGVALALGAGLFATLVGLDRERGFYPTVMIVIAMIYVLFAAIGGTTQSLIIESGVALVFIAASVAGFRSSLWLVVAALFAHGVFDSVHGKVIENRGVPVWWPMFCLAYDVAASGYLAWLLTRRRVPTNAR